jgi:hypothetical protein
MVTLVTQDTGQRQSRDNGNISHTRHRTKTPETMVTLVTQDTEQRLQRHWVFVLCLVWLMLPVSLESLFCVLCDQCYQCLWSLCPVSCVTNVTSFSELSLSCVLCDQCYQFLWIFIVLCLVWPMLPVSLNCLCPVSCVTYVTSVSGVFVLFLVWPVLVTQDTGQRLQRHW